MFTSISEDNSGKYVCKAITSEGPLETSALLNVEPAKRKRKHLPKNLTHINDNKNNHESKIHRATLSNHHPKIYEKYKNPHNRLNKERLHYVLVNSKHIPQKPYQSLRKQELRKQRQRFAEARRQHHRILRENLERQKAAKTKGMPKIEEFHYVNHHKAIVSKNNDKKYQKLNYHHYDINTGNEKPEKTSIFRKWLASN